MGAGLGKGVKRMRKFQGGHSVGKGTYWNMKYGSLVEMKHEGVLPGGPNTTYYRIHIAAVIFVVMALGGLYVIFLPLIINAYAIYFLGKRMFGGVLTQARRSVSFGWRPTEAYLAGKGKKKENSEHKTE